jgi:hypothetical protein
MLLINSYKLIRDCILSVPQARACFGCKGPTCHSLQKDLKYGKPSDLLLKELRHSKRNQI